MGFVQPPNDKARTAFISRGLGTTALPMRTFCPAELVMLELQPA
jgi:predicted MPP superfamily phosphohydrolase